MQYFVCTEGALLTCTLVAVLWLLPLLLLCFCCCSDSVFLPHLTSGFTAADHLMPLLVLLLALSAWSVLVPEALTV